MDPQILIIGTGPGPLSLLTREAEEELLKAEKIFFRMSGLPVYHWLKEQNKQLICFDTVYAISNFTASETYEFIADAIIKEAQTRGHVVYALPGNPFVFERTTRLICHNARTAGMAVRVVPGISFLETIYQELALDPVVGLQILTLGALRSSATEYSQRLGLVIGLIGATVGSDSRCQKPNIEFVARCLLEQYPPNHPVSLVWTPGMPDYETHSKTFALENLVEQCGDCNFFASLYVPPIGEQPETHLETTPLNAT